MAKLLVLAAIALGLTVSVVNASQMRASRVALQQLLSQLSPEGTRSKFLKAVKSHDANVSDFPGTSLEDQVADLVVSKAQAAFGKTPFGESVSKIRTLIDEQMQPEVLKSHDADQKELENLASALSLCGSNKVTMVAIADKSKANYLQYSPLHKTCRTGQAGMMTAKMECYAEKNEKKKVMELKWETYQLVDGKLKDQTSNKEIMEKQASESTESYLNRISDTVCGKDTTCGGSASGDGDSGAAAKCGTVQCGFRCQFQCAKTAFETAKKEYEDWTAKCDKVHKQYDEKVVACDNLQDMMDGGACKRAVDMKDACETYSECYTTKKQAYKEMETVVLKSESDRKDEWVGLKRMDCLLRAFIDGKVSDGEVHMCNEKNHTTSMVTINYPVLDEFQDCVVPRLYPTTGEYKKAEFAPLPALAKGKDDANECTGVLEIQTTPAAGSPASCKCERVTLNGPYSPGPMVKCEGCLDVYKATDASSCPAGTKIFAPASREDWHTILKSVEPLRAPNWIVDVTRPQNGCEGCDTHDMNSNTAQGATWVTTDGAPWWLRSTKHKGPSGDYYANCFLDVFAGKSPGPDDGDDVTWTAGACNYHSKSYYCQLESQSMVPKEGSPAGCRCKKVELTGPYTAGILIKCQGCLEVAKSTDKNSCPKGTKIFSPQTRDDWKTFIDSATPLRAPSWIIDVTRPADGCGGCSEAPMNSDDLAQKTWRTADGSPWWLRSTTYTEPSGDYSANCYMDLWHNPENENSIGFNDAACNNKANAYYCQPVKKAAAPSPPPAAAA